MSLVLHLAWILITVLRFAGVIIVFGGVGLFGVYFIAGNAKAAKRGDGAVPGSSWHGMWAGLERASGSWRWAH